MKFNKSILTAVLGLSMASLCNAGTVYVTGSTACRSTFYAACTNINTVFTNTQPTFTGYGGAGPSDSYMAFSGTLVGGSGTTVIKCHWSGSEGGVLDVASNNVVQEQFIADSALGTGDSASVGALTTPQNVDLGMADNAQVYSRTKTPTLTGAKVGVITFEWVRNPGWWTGTNVTESQIRQALAGACPLAVFTGNAADTGSYVYVEGRDNLSGTRVNALGECGYGIFTPVNQIEINTSGVMQDVDLTGNYIGDFGFSSGGTLAGTLGVDTTGKTDSTINGGTGFSIIAYLGLSDAATAIANGAKPCSFNGVPFSPAAVKEGTYGFWGNEYIFKSPNAGSEAQSAYNLLSATTGINNFCDGTKAIKLTDMHSTRPGPNGDPAHN